MTYKVVSVMKSNIKCDDCGAMLSHNVVALNKKLIARDTQKFLCLECLSDFMGCSVQDLEIKIEDFKEQGCTLFD